MKRCFSFGETFARRPTSRTRLTVATRPRANIRRRGHVLSSRPVAVGSRNDKSLEYAYNSITAALISKGRPIVADIDRYIYPATTALAKRLSPTNARSARFDLSAHRVRPLPRELNRNFTFSGVVASPLRTTLLDLTRKLFLIAFADYILRTRVSWRVVRSIRRGPCRFYSRADNAQVRRLTRNDARLIGIAGWKSKSPNLRDEISSSK